MTPNHSPAGLISVNKPRGVSSRFVVDRVARALGEKKAGHAGTLDPLASGVLVVALGFATRLIEYVQQQPKRYRATFALGRSSPTDDLEGELTILDERPLITREQIEQALRGFVGAILQRPPIYSAIKFNGRRSYALARRGKEVELAARMIHIYELTLVRFDSPEWVVDVTCSQGTYIRSLGRDVAEALGTVAVMTELERTAIGGFTVVEACPWDEIESNRAGPWLQSPFRAVEHLPRVTLSEHEIEQFNLGRLIPQREMIAAAELVAIDEQGQFVGIIAPANTGAVSDPVWRIVRNFAAHRGG